MAHLQAATLCFHPAIYLSMQTLPPQSLHSVSASQDTRQRTTVHGGGREILAREQYRCGWGYASQDIRKRTVEGAAGGMLS